MPLYKCKVIDFSGQRKTIIREANDELMLKAQMRQDRIHMLNYKILKEEKEKEFFALGGRVKYNEVITFLRQFSVMLKAGIPISDCLNNLHRQKYSKAFSAKLERFSPILPGRSYTSANTRAATRQSSMARNCS